MLLVDVKMRVMMIICTTNIELVVLMSINMVDRMIVSKVIGSSAVTMLNHIVDWLPLIFYRVSWVLFNEYRTVCTGNVAIEVI